ncbi:MAG: GNAT family N-acetyltransferase [Chloroflexi bacterium]|nr:MAG: GNAT family N-acetyltransferase [Chloroflexota bacterium]
MKSSQSVKFDVVPYDQVDSTDVLELNLLSLDYPLTPERAALIRRLDPRTFPCFALYAVEKSSLYGQALLYRLPMISKDGPEDVGGIGLMCTHPRANTHAIVARLLEESHEYMRQAGLKFSTIWTSRLKASYRQYQDSRYIDAVTSSTVLARCANVNLITDLAAERPGSRGSDLAGEFYQRTSKGRLGFASRHPRFFSLMTATGEIRPGSLWLLWDGDALAGYAVARFEEGVLKVDELRVSDNNTAARAVAALILKTESIYVQVSVQNPILASSLLEAGYPTPVPSWNSLVVKPLLPGLSAEDFALRFGIGTGNFLFSYLDTAL